MSFPESFDWLPHALLQRLELDWLSRAGAGVEVAVLRLDLIDPLISGNKWFKLTEHLATARSLGAQGVISLGGAHSNHLHALAAAGRRFAFPTVGLLRGHPQDTPTVLDLQAFGMHLHWLGYAGYRERHAPGFWAEWQARYPGLHPVPEGGGGLAGASGCRVLREQVQKQLPALGWSDYHAWWLAAGTGTTLAGLVLAEAGRTRCTVPWRCPRIMGWRSRSRAYCARLGRAAAATNCWTAAAVVLPRSTSLCAGLSGSLSSNARCRWSRCTPARPCWPCRSR